jgi:hypothetical protein
MITCFTLSLASLLVSGLPLRISLGDDAFRIGVGDTAGAIGGLITTERNPFLGL